MVVSGGAVLLGVDSALAYTNESRRTNSLQLFAGDGGGDGGGCALHPVDEIEHAESPSRYVAAATFPLSLLAAKSFSPDIDILFSTIHRIPSPNDAAKPSRPWFSLRCNDLLRRLMLDAVKFENTWNGYVWEVRSLSTGTGRGFHILEDVAKEYLKQKIVAISWTDFFDVITFLENAKSRNVNK